MNLENENNPTFIDRLKESPRTVSALIVILIVAAAIYAFSGEQPGKAEEATSSPTESDAPAETPVAAEENAPTETTNPNQASTPTNTAAPVALQNVTRADLQNLANSLPAATRNDQDFVETAQAGDGLTHLARRASLRWLADNDAGYELTHEHRVFIEDYIQNRLGNESLEIGETRNISTNMIAEAVAAAGQLNTSQLHNLSSYAPAVASI